MSQEPILGGHHSEVSISMPGGACDCHVHVFGPVEQFPMWEERPYTPPAAPVQSLQAHQAALKLDRVIVVQPSVYGTNNSCTLDAVRAIGSGARGIAVVDRQVSGNQLDALAGQGIVGIRLNLAAGAVVDPDRIRRDLEWAFDLTAPLGWHVHVFTELNIVSGLEAILSQAPVPVVIDHFGRADAGKGLDQPGLQTLLALVASGRAYVKLSAPYLISGVPGLSDVGPLVGAFVKANPDRLLWGSNWPHPGGGIGKLSTDGIAAFRAVDDGEALDRLAAWVDDDDALRRILVHNPASLFGFADDDGLKQ